MVETVKHSTMTGVDAHSITRWEVATSAELPTELVAADLHKVAYVADTATYLILTAIEPAIVWTSLSYKADNPVVEAEQTGQDVTLTFEDGTSFAFTLPTVPDAPNSVMAVTVDGNGDLVVTFLDNSTTLLELPYPASYEGNAIEYVDYNPSTGVLFFGYRDMTSSEFTIEAGGGDGGDGGGGGDGGAVIGQLRLVPINVSGAGWLPASELEVNSYDNPDLFDAVAAPEVSTAYTSRTSSTISISELGTSAVMGVCYPGGNTTAYLVPNTGTSPSGMVFNGQTSTGYSLDSAADGVIKGHILTSDSENFFEFLVVNGTSIKMFSCGGTGGTVQELVDLVAVDASITDAALIGKTSNGYEFLVKTGGTDWQFATLDALSETANFYVNTIVPTYVSDEWNQVMQAVGNDKVYQCLSGQLLQMDNLTSDASTLTQYLNAQPSQTPYANMRAADGKLFIIQEDSGTALDIYDAEGNELVTDISVFGGNSPVSDMVLYKGAVWVTTRSPVEAAEPMTLLAAYSAIDGSVILDTPLLFSPTGDDVEAAFVQPYISGGTTGAMVAFERPTAGDVVFSYVPYFTMSPYTLPTLTPPGAGFKYEIYAGV